MGAAAPPATLPTAPMQSAALHHPLSLTRPTQPFAFAGATPCRRHPYGVGHPPHDYAWRAAWAMRPESLRTCHRRELSVSKP
jgi:hypothetical protein